MRSYLHFAKGLDPVADAFAGTVVSDVVSMRNHRTVCFLIHKGIGVTGTSKITVEACSTAAAAAVAAVPFRYQAITSDDVHSEMVDCESTGFDTIAGSSQRYAVYVDHDDLVLTGYEFVRLKAVEVVDSPVLGGIEIIMLDPRNDQAVQDTVLS